MGKLDFSAAVTANALGPTSYSWLRCVLDWRIATVIAVLVSRDWNGRSVLGRGKCKRQPVLVSYSERVLRITG